ncbi:MAG TPA: hypothetical protein EYP10_10565, partial [Armatimonadetes bacterium]|nr:hypothetical protein [Armatimonadota bacterium]
MAFIFALAAGWMIAVVILMLGIANTIAMRRMEERFEELVRPTAELEEAEIILDERLQQSFAERVLRPFVERLGHAMHIPADAVQQMDALLE